VLVFAGDFGWSDIGSWKAVAEEHDGDAQATLSAAKSFSPT